MAILQLETLATKPNTSKDTQKDDKTKKKKGYSTTFCMRSGVCWGRHF